MVMESGIVFSVPHTPVQAAMKRALIRDETTISKIELQAGRNNKGRRGFLSGVDLKNL